MDSDDFTGLHIVQDLPSLDLAKVRHLLVVLTEDHCLNSDAAATPSAADAARLDGAEEGRQQYPTRAARPQGAIKDEV